MHYINEREHCKLCGRDFKHLGSHITMGHKMKARDYKKQFNLSLNTPLISQEVQNKKKAAFEEKREYYLKNIQNEDSKKYQFKKGQVPKKQYISKESIQKAIQNIQEVNKENEKPRKCPYCESSYNHLEAHLYTKHGLVIIKIK